MCIDCAATLALGFHRSFRCSNGACLCYDCALRRGAVYDFPRECWLIAPESSADMSEVAY